MQPRLAGEWCPSGGPCGLEDAAGAVCLHNSSVNNTAIAVTTAAPGMQRPWHMPGAAVVTAMAVLKLSCCGASAGRQAIDGCGCSVGVRSVFGRSLCRNDGALC
jgi:hypothetical protein